MGVAAVVAGLLGGLPGAGAWGEEPAIDYDTVDIASLSRLQLTFVPEKRKEPIFRGILAGAQWRINKRFPPQPYCQQFLDDLIAWRGIEIVEPDLRANACGAPEFAFIRNQCPQLDPHAVEARQLGLMYGSYDFLVWLLKNPAPVGQRIIMTFQGYRPATEIDRLGNILTKDFQYDTGGGQYVRINLKRCTSSGVSVEAPVNFSYYFVPAGSRFYDESTIVKYKGAYYLLSMSYAGPADRGLSLVPLSQPSIAAKRACFATAP